MLQPNEQKSQDQKRRQLYILAALIKSLADVPEQIWHALEGHQYLQAGSLYILAQQVHEYLETEESFMIDTDLAFPVVQRQWDAISFFRPQIIQKSINHLRVVVLESEEVAKIIVGLMQLDDMAIKGTLETLLEMRTKAIDELINQLMKEKSNNQELKLSRHLRDMAYIIKRTLIHVHHIYLPLEKTNHSSPSQTSQSLIEYYVEQMQKKFTIPISSTSSSNINNNDSTDINIKTIVNGSLSSSSSSSLPAVARLFAPSTNVHLLIRYLPECIQSFTPKFKLENRSNELNKDIITDMVTKWLKERKEQLEIQLITILQSIPTNQKLTEIRTKLWDLLYNDEYDESGKIEWKKICNEVLQNHYSIYEKIFRSPLNTRAKQIIDTECSSISKQPIEIIWPSLVNIKNNTVKKNFQLAPIIWPTIGIHSNLNLPNFSSSTEIANFKKALHEASTERTPLLTESQFIFDQAWNQLRNDVNHHILTINQDDHFYSQTDANEIQQYFRDQCEQTTVKYIDGLQNLIEQLKQWPHQNIANDISIWIGRLARLLSEDSKELPKSLSLMVEGNDIFELKSGVGKDATYAQLQEKLYTIYQEAHNGWIEQACKNFVQQLSNVLKSTKWNDQCPYILAWENISNEENNDIVLPTIASNGIENVIFGICKEIQRIQCTRLDMVILQKLCQQLYEHLIETFNSFISTTDGNDDTLASITEKGALQLLFDISFIVRVLQDHKHSISTLSFLQPLKDKVDPINWAVFETYYDGNVERFYLKQTLLLGILLRTNNETFERARKAMIGNQHGQQQYNVLPLAPQAQRFTLLPIGHGTSIRSR
ncbi:unnamed protein product [Cunninghamella echinulata]